MTAESTRLQEACGQQTGWSGVIARIMYLVATSTSEQVLELGKLAAITKVEQESGSRPGAQLQSTQSEVREPLYPSLYQINTRVWLTKLARSLGLLFEQIISPRRRR